MKYLHSILATIGNWFRVKQVSHNKDHESLTNNTKNARKIRKILCEAGEKLNHFALVAQEKISIFQMFYFSSMGNKSFRFSTDLWKQLFLLCFDSKFQLFLTDEWSMTKNRKFVFRISTLMDQWTINMINDLSDQEWSQIKISCCLSNAEQNIMQFW